MVSGRPTVSQGTTFLKLKPWDERTRTQQQVAAELAPQMMAIPGVVAFPSSPPPLGQGIRDKPIQMVIETSRPYAELQVMVDKMLDKAADNPGLVNVDTDLKLNAPQLEVDSRPRQGCGGRRRSQPFGRTLETLLGGRDVTSFKRDGGQYDVMVKVADIDRPHPEPPHLCARARWRHDPAVEPRERAGDGRAEGAQPFQPAALRHHHVAAALGYSLSDGLDFLEKTATKVLPPTTRIRLRRSVARVRESSQASTHLPPRARFHLPRARGAI